jgi:hypothetical protein
MSEEEIVLRFDDLDRRLRTIERALKTLAGIDAEPEEILPIGDYVEALHQGRIALRKSGT